MVSIQDAKIILKDKCIDSLIEASHPKYHDSDDFDLEYLGKVYGALKRLKRVLNKAAKGSHGTRRR